MSAEIMSRLAAKLQPTLAWAGPGFVITAGTSWLVFALDGYPPLRLRGGAAMAEARVAVSRLAYKMRRCEPITEPLTTGGRGVVLRNHTEPTIGYTSSTVHVPLAHEIIEDLEDWLDFIAGNGGSPSQLVRISHAGPERGGIARLVLRSLTTGPVPNGITVGTPCVLEEFLLARCCELRGPTTELVHHMPTGLGCSLTLTRLNGAQWQFEFQRASGDCLRLTVAHSDLARIALALAAARSGLTVGQPVTVPSGTTQTKGAPC